MYELFCNKVFSLFSTVADVFLPEVSTQPRPPASDRGESQLNQSKGGNVFGSKSKVQTRDDFEPEFCKSSRIGSELTNCESI